MRKLLSLVLALVMVASLTVVAVGAAGASGAATVTLKGLQGETVSQTYAVGETFTAYTYLNVSQINEGRIGSLDGSLIYPAAVLEVAETYNTDVEDYDYGMIDNLNTVFPILGTAAVGNAGKSGVIKYNASKSALSGFEFNSDTSSLSVVRFKVIAAGEATIENTMMTLASSDRNLTRIIAKGVIQQGKENFTTPVALSEPATPVVTGYTVSGVATSYKTNDGVDDVTLKLTGSDNNYTDTVTVTATYTGVTATTDYAFENVPAGEYTLSVEKGNHVTREYTVSVSADTTQDVKICPIGDVNMNGRVQSNDATKAYKHVQGGAEDQLTDYAFKCADVNKNGRIQSNDATQIYRQTTGAHNLF